MFDGDGEREGRPHVLENAVSCRKKLANSSVISLFFFFNVGVMTEAFAHKKLNSSSVYKYRDHRFKTFQSSKVIIAFFWLNPLFPS